MAVDQVELLDAGGDRRLERFGERIVDRPASAIGPPRDHLAWDSTDLRFEVDRWEARDPRLLEPWDVEIEGVRLELRPTASGQLGLFPEHRLTLPWLLDRIRARSPRDEPPSVLNLFAYTGLATLVLAAAGASVTHVDAQRSVVAWARRNSELSGLADRPIRWIVDDAIAFAEREGRRARRYDVIVLDPPAYGHADGRSWQLARDLPRLLGACALVARPGAAVLLTAHSTGVEPEDLGAVVGDAFPTRGMLDVVPLDLRASSGALLPLGHAVRLEPAVRPEP